MTLAATVGAATSGPQRIAQASVTTTSTQIADDTDAKVTFSLGKGETVLLQVVGAGTAGASWTAGSVYLTANASGSSVGMVPTGQACTFGRSGKGLLTWTPNYPCEVGAETSSDFAGTASVLVKKLG